MLAFFPGEVQVLTPAAGVLRIFYPVDAIAACAFAFSLAFVLFMARLVYRSKGGFPWLAVVIGPFMLYFCLDALCYRGTITLSQPEQTMTVEEHSFYYSHTNTYPLSAFDRAFAESGSSWNKQLVLVRPSGAGLHFGNGFTGRSGIDHAAHTIDAFLSRNAHP